MLKTKARASIVDFVVAVVAAAKKNEYPLAPSLNVQAQMDSSILCTKYVRYFLLTRSFLKLFSDFVSYDNVEVLLYTLQILAITFFFYTKGHP